MNRISLETSEAAAIIGIGCRLPGGIVGPASLLTFLRAHGDAIVDVPADRWSGATYYDPDAEVPGKAYVHRGAFLQQSPFDFDPEPFGISPREAERLDPQQRLLLETTWEALEDAALPVERIRGTRTSVFVGGFTLDYQTLAYSEHNRRLINAHTSVGASMTVLSNRLSYTFDLRGPSMTVDTACSSSLVATHLGCRSLSHDGCELSIVGGVNVMLSPATTIAMCKGHFLSPDGRSKAFDAAADGYGRGEGAAVVILKDLASALRDGDRIYALIRATGVNQDGRTDGMAMPSEEAQRMLAASVLRASGLAAEDIAYVEAHGTGTRAGDPVEARALGAVYGGGRQTPLRIGSLKTNLGHMEAAAGVAGLIKAALCVGGRTILPQRALDRPNPDIPFGALGLQVAVEEEPWPVATSAHAAVNSFGYGGTNAHVIVSEWPAEVGQTSPASDGVGVRSDRRQLIVPVSAANRAALSAHAASLAKVVSDPLWRDQARTLACGRSHLPERLVVLAASGADLGEALASFARGENSPSCVTGRASIERKLLWVFTGMGPQWWAMGHDLYAKESQFRQGVLEADAAFQKAGGFSILAEMLRDEASSTMKTNRIAQPANFVLQVGLVRLLRALGVPCDGVLGHSVGELAAAWAAGCLSLEEAAFVAYHRSRIQQQSAGKGALLATAIGYAEVQPLLAEVPGVTIASYNAPRSITLAGSHQALTQIAAALEAAQIFHRRMNVEVAYHSPQMDEHQREFLEALAPIRPAPPNTALFSTVRGARQHEAIHDAQYFWENARLPVMLQPAVEAAIDDSYGAFLEIGPHPVLAGAIRELLEHRGKDGRTFFCMKRNQPEQETLLRTVGELHASGVRVDFAQLFPQGRSSDLPHYPFQRVRHWAESLASASARTGELGTADVGLHRDSGPTPRFRCDLRGPRWRGVADHQIQGVAIFPAAAFVQAARSAVDAFRGETGQVVFEQFRFERALAVRPAASPELLADIEESSAKVRLFARHEEEAWQPHAEARIVPDAHFVSARLDLEALLQETAETLSPEWLYRHFRTLGLDYGKRFQALHAVRVHRERPGEGWVLARLQLPETTDCDVPVHAVLLDAGFQALLGIDTTRSLLPTRIGELRFGANTAVPAWAYGRARPVGETELLADLVLLDESGSVLVDVRDLVCRALDPDAKARSANEARWFHRETWEPRPWPIRSFSGPGLWAIAGKARRWAAALSDALALVGVATTSLPAAISGKIAFCDKLVFAIEPDAGDPAGIEACDRLRAAVKTALQQGCSLRVVTFGAQAVLEGESTVPAQAALWGFARVIMTEYPKLRCHLLDLGATADHSLGRAIDVLDSSAGEEEIAIRGDRLWVRRLRREEGWAQVPDRIVSGPSHEGACVLERGDGDGMAYVARERAAPDHAEIEVLALAAAVGDSGGEQPAWLPGGGHNEGRPCAWSAVGRVLRVGDGVANLRPGAMVHALAPMEVSSHVVVPASCATQVVSGHSPGQALAYGHFFTAWYALHDLARLRAEQTVLLLGACTTMTFAAAQIARIAGARSVAIVPNERQSELLLRQGVEHVERAADLDAMKRLQDVVGPIHVVLSALTGSARAHALSGLCPGGVFIDLVAGSDAPLADYSAIGRNLTYCSLDPVRLPVDRAACYASVTRDVLAALAAGLLELVPEDVVAGSDPVPVSPKDMHVLDLSDGAASVRRDPMRIPLLRGDRTYLITGGLGGFGLATAEWLVSEGARHLVLGSRRGSADAESAPTLARIERQGAHVTVLALDVTSPASLDAALAHVRDHLPPLAGIFHSAMILEDLPISTLSRGAIERVLSVKALGAWQLHEKTVDCILDFFVLYSSVSALIGNPNQAAYGAANAFLDALAIHRRARGLCATSVSWGAIGDVGVVARDTATESHLRALGLRPMPAVRALSALKKALLRECSHVGIVDVDWTKWMASFPDVPWNRLEHLSERDSEGGDEPLARLRAELGALDDEARRQGVLDRVAAVTASVLRLEPARLDVDASLRSHGLDSLMAVELQLALERTVGVSIPMIELLAGASVGGLVQSVLARMRNVRAGLSSLRQAPRTDVDLRSTFLSRICVQPPYFDLHDLTVNGDYVEATARPVPPSHCEEDVISCAEASRHLAILGSCAASLRCPLPGKVYYPLQRAYYLESKAPRRIPSDERLAPHERVLLRARCTGFDMRTSIATAETEAIDRDGHPIFALAVEYRVIPHEQFALLFRDRAEPTLEASGPNPYLSLQPLSPPEYDDGVVTLSLGRVDPASCLGHFVGYPALPVSVMARDAIRLVAEGVRRNHGWKGARVTTVGGGVNTEAFIFAHEPVTMKARLVRSGSADHHEVWQCTAFTHDRVSVRFEFELFVREEREKRLQARPSVLRQGGTGLG